MVRMKIIMPEALAGHQKSVRDKGRYIVQALEEKIQRERSRQLRTVLAKAYADSADEDRALDKDWSGALKVGSGNE